jgi:hypothetical protein
MSPELPLTSMPGDDEENLHRAIQLATKNPRVGGSIDSDHCGAILTLRAASLS